MGVIEGEAVPYLERTQIRAGRDQILNGLDRGRSLVNNQWNLVDDDNNARTTVAKQHSHII